MGLYVRQDRQGIGKGPRRRDARAMMLLSPAATVSAVLSMYKPLAEAFRRREDGKMFRRVKISNRSVFPFSGLICGSIEQARVAKKLSNYGLSNARKKVELHAVRYLCAKNLRFRGGFATRGIAMTSGESLLVYAHPGLV